MHHKRAWDGAAVFLKYKHDLDNPYAKLLEFRSFVERAFPGKMFRFVVVDNGVFDADIERQLWRGCDWIPGDNTWREFSGLEVGLRWLERTWKMESNTPIVLANDTFASNYGSNYLNLFSPDKVAAAVSDGNLMGWVDGYPQPVEFLGRRFQSWVRTSLIIATAGSLSKCRPLYPEIRDADIFSSDWREFFRPDAPLSKNYREYLKTWLFSDFEPKSTFKEKWHSQVELSASSFDSMKGKAKSIFCEHLFTARARAAGVRVFDVRTMARS